MINLIFPESSFALFLVVVAAVIAVTVVIV